MKYHEIRISFNDEEYFIEPRGNNHFNIYYTVMFYSENGSTLNFGSTYRSSLRYHILPSTEIKKIYFKNLTFKDYDGYAIKTHLLYFGANTEKNDIQIEFENCTFVDIYVTFKNCTFTNIDQFLFVEDKRNPKINNNNNLIYFENCYFDNYRFLGVVQYGDITFNHCYLKEGQGFNEYPSTFIYTTSNLSSIKVINSIFEDNNIIHYKPLFSLNESSLKIMNTKFKNCHTAYGYLFYLRTSITTAKYKQNLIIDNCDFNDVSALIDGNNNNILIINSKFQNIDSKSTLPILNSKYSLLTVSNVEFKNVM
ncbi:hypothetical protein PIROE2DRAFT_6965 [Piromyces sp. E2]|nr:hypothetical protein PIROE2DRAFT_6965 [Piromyces sp. E2]|eukprot:OUM65975.1 hypothetical protein PIROE2DRAFT_6965 [Piromyces sp. E2]